MVLRQRATLLLGGLISVSNVGCAAVNALVGAGDAVPANRHTSAERMVAIARVFENQGRFDRAKALYQQANQLAPEDPVIRQQLTQLASRRQVQEFQADPKAVAQSDAVSRRSRTVAKRPAVSAPGDLPLARSTPARSTAARSTAARSTAARLAKADAAKARKALARKAKAPADSAPAYPPLEQVLMPLTSETTESLTEGAGNAAETEGNLTVTVPAPPISEALAETPDVAALTDGEPMSAPVRALRQSAENSSGSLSVGTGIVPASLEDTEPDAALWLKVLAEGSDLNNRVLAASMLGDCDVRNEVITEALSQQLEQATDHELILAIADSQQHRGEPTARTAERISEVALTGSPERQIQAVASLRSFVGTASESQCMMTLHQLLDSDSGSIRAAAAVAMGDHTVTNPETLVILTQLAAEDPDAEVRHASRTALTRRHPGTRETASAVRVH